MICDRRINESVRWGRRGLAVLALLVACVALSAAQDKSFQLDPAQTTVKFTVGDVLHTVRGTFRLRHGSLEFDPATGKISGEIVVDAQSGDSGSGARDRKMDKEILESSRYPDIAFRPDRVEGPVANRGKSSVRVHGTFSIHGVDHDMTVPAEVEVSEDHWTAAVHFTVPYEKWGMKNPSTLFLRVNNFVDIDLTAAGNVVKPPIANSVR
ncbi:MAG TPA: YceI family protein [Candidatus Sulfotelmatobacter sp.]|nr:YceI family protein [Candidatus Sulfotelmatobacter sp.]